MISNAVKNLALTDGGAKTHPSPRLPSGRSQARWVILHHFAGNPITKAVVVGGMEPVLQVGGLTALISLFRRSGQDAPFVIYTGCYPEETPKELERLKQYVNIIVKFGRFILDQTPHFDEVLSIRLASVNQYAKKIS